AMICQPQTQAQTSITDDTPIMDGMRNDTLSKMAFDMRKAGMSLAEILIALTAVNSRCAPPLTPAELKVIVNGKKAIHPALLLDSRVLGDQQLNERRKQRFTPLAHVVHELEESQVQREFLLGNAPMRAQPTPQERPVTVDGQIALSTSAPKPRMR